MISDLRWIGPLGVGYLPPTTLYDYDSDYWAEYQRRDASPMGSELTTARLDLVSKFATPTQCVDVGVGGGRFVTEAGCWGTDVNLQAINWLRERGQLWEGQPFESMTFWDSIEHIENPAYLLNQVKRFAFISTPIYTSHADVLESKHFKPNEHLWYFTDKGLRFFMRGHGFICRERNDIESRLGREAIGTYVFEKLND